MVNTREPLIYACGHKLIWKRSHVKEADPCRQQGGAAKIVDSEGMVRAVNSTRWEVASQSTPGLRYAVDVTAAGIKCKCSHNVNRKSPCKHAIAVEILMLRVAGVGDADLVVLEKVVSRCPNNRDYS